jgi:hypothetical protein
VTTGQPTAPRGRDQDAAADATAALPAFTPDALTSPDLNISISIDGVTLLHEGSVTAFSDPGNFAIAIGANTDATATGGLLESAIAIGSNDTADTYGGDLNTAVATGTGGDATATDGNFESAYADSAVADAYGGNSNSAFATDGSDATATHGNLLSAFASGQNALADSYNGTGEATSATGAGSSAFAENGSFGSAIADGAGANAEAQWGTGDEAFVFGDSTATAGGNSADLGNYDIAAAFGNWTMCCPAPAYSTALAASTWVRYLVTASVRPGRPARTGWSKSCLRSDPRLVVACRRRAFKAARSA